MPKTCIKVDGVHQYWETDIRYDQAENVMSPICLQLLVWKLHLVDNMRISEDGKKDILWKLRPCLAQMRENSLKLTAEEHCSMYKNDFPL